MLCLSAPLARIGSETFCCRRHLYMKCGVRAVPTAILVCNTVLCALAQGPTTAPANKASAQDPTAAIHSRSLSTYTSPSLSTSSLDCEQHILQRLGWQHAYNSGGYSLTAELPQNCSIDIWQSLGCLISVTNITLTGSLPVLPDSWASNGSFPYLLALNLSTTKLSGTLPSAWSNPTAFPRLQMLNLSNTDLTGTLPETWANAGALSQLADLHLASTKLTGPVAAARISMYLCTCKAVSLAHV